MLDVTPIASQRIHVRNFTLSVLIFAGFATAACGQQKPSTEQTTSAIAAWYKTVSPQVNSPTIEIKKIGEAGKGDFAAPGSQDSYWPAEFTVHEVVIDLGPHKVSATKAHGIAYIWQDKLGTWRVGKIEPLPIEASPPPGR
jgi:hypothetical protein